MNEEVMDHLSQEVALLRKDLEEQVKWRNSTGYKVWEVLSKLAVAAMIGMFTWVWTLDARVKDNDTRLQKIEDTKFTKADALELKAALMAHSDPQMALLVADMRSLSISVIERLTKLEVRLDQLSK